jgi:hypothetical protein
MCAIPLISKQRLKLFEISDDAWPVTRRGRSASGMDTVAATQIYLQRNQASRCNKVSIFLGLSTLIEAIENPRQLAGVYWQTALNGEGFVESKALISGDSVLPS